MKHVTFGDSKLKKESMHKRGLTSDIDIDCREGSQWYSSNILSSNPQHEVLGGLIVQGLCHQDRCRTILSVGGQVKANWHVGLWDHAILQIIRYSGISKRWSGFDGLFGAKIRKEGNNKGKISKQWDTSLFCLRDTTTEGCHINIKISTEGSLV